MAIDDNAGGGSEPVEIRGRRDVALKPFAVYPAIGVAVAVVAIALIPTGAMSEVDGLGLAIGAILVSVGASAAIGLSWLLTGCRVRYSVSAHEVIATRGHIVKFRIQSDRIVDVGFVDMLGWEGLLFCYPWPEFPYLFVKVADAAGHSTEVRLPGIAVWGTTQIATLEREIRQVIFGSPDDELQNGDKTPTR
ncbi:MAG: hypothetical protein H7288_04785 [Kineosporiaceae bacterium]|nr:hypothetical protein [Aeromicrobium sp.]